MNDKGSSLKIGTIPFKLGTTTPTKVYSFERCKHSMTLFYSRSFSSVEKLLFLLPFSFRCAKLMLKSETNYAIISYCVLQEYRVVLWLLNFQKSYILKKP